MTVMSSACSGVPAHSSAAAIAKPFAQVNRSFALQIGNLLGFDVTATFGHKTPTKPHAGAASLPRWPVYDLARRSTMIFDTRSHIENDPRKWQRELFARIPYIQPGT